MKKIALLFAIVMGIGMMFSSTCKQDPYEAPPGVPVDTTGGTGSLNNKPTTAYWTVFVEDSTQTNTFFVGATVCVFKSKATMMAAIAAGNVLNQCINSGGQITTAHPTSGNYVTIGPWPAANVSTGTTTTYYLWASYTNSSLTPPETHTVTDSIQVNACKTCLYNATMDLPAW